MLPEQARTTLSPTEHRVCEVIGARGDDLVRQLAAHVAIPTGGGHRPGLDEYRGVLAERLAGLGADTQVLDGAKRPAWLDPPGSPVAAGPPPPILVARRRADGGHGPRILVVGHLDTVHDPGASFRELTADKGGRTATGPGAADMKGGIVIALTALEALAEAGADVNWTVLLNSDEETGSFCSEAVLRAQAAEHDVGIVVEPALAGGALAIERSGSGQFMVEVFGRAAHAGRDFKQGVSAVVTLARLITALHGMTALEQGLIVNVGPLAGGKVTNAVPDHAALWGNVRYPDPGGARRLAESIESLAAEGMPRVIVHKRWNRPAKPATYPVRRLAGLAQSAAEDLGQPLPLMSTAGVCDGNILQDAGLPTLDSLGVRGGNLHRTDEFVEIDSLVDRCRMLAVILARITDKGTGFLEISEQR